MTPLSWCIATLISFAFGSIPTGYLIGKARGIDIRKFGSGNIGATNVGRVFGRKAWVLCFSGDFLKGFVPVLGIGLYAGIAGRWLLPTPDSIGWCTVLSAAVVGHMFCPWLGFKGGKGVATALGSLLGLFPVLTVGGLGALAIFLLVLWAYRYVSLAAVIATASLPVLVLLEAIPLGVFGGNNARPLGIANALGAVLPMATITGITASVMIWKHRGNMARIRAGNEPKVGQRVEVPIPSSAPRPKVVSQ